MEGWRGSVGVDGPLAGNERVTVHSADTVAMCESSNFCGSIHQISDWGGGARARAGG